MVLILLFAPAWPGSMGNVHATQAGSKPKRVISSMVIEKAIFEEKDGKAVEMPRRKFAEATFDAKGNVVESKIFFPKTDLFLRYVAKRDADGKKLEDAYFEANGKQAGKRTYAYDAEGRVSEILSNLAWKDEKFKIVIKREASGRIAEIVENDLKEKTSERTAYLYRDAESVIEAREFDEKGISKSTHGYKFDAEGRLAIVQQLHRLDKEDKSGALYPGLIEQTTFGPQGVPVEEFLSYGDVTSHERHLYEFDADGNWTTRRIELAVPTKSGEVFVPFETTYRTIVYGNEAPTEKTAKDRFGDFIESKALKFSLRGRAYDRRVPDYPPQSKNAGLSGYILTALKVSETGRTMFAFGEPVRFDRQRINEYQPLIQSARAAAFSWKFNPTLSEGMPATTTGEITFSFTTNR
jgi:hypothetical protein